ncbi:glycosyl transferase possibly involved in lipopolysaccharide synthesis [Xenococcus sp. PCC 7305]|uniref:sugar transferase n=1 Tax=Xenococcus sp. PCC 7305 TaxID=102125 RepID=UPI0002ACC0E6|nr:sugar transferase [Xenococcus sp. PCC 7305]ELS04170.1 glycosyl transferase possibly involved in lipopolysaccharide synthesis [Xenococcus sp. PCC 7305]
MNSPFSFALTLSDNQRWVHPSVPSPAKRFLDIVGGLVGLAITLLLAVPIAIAMQLDSPGPVLYGQIRCGLNGKKFRIWKFRSMIVNAEQQKHLVENKAQGHIFKNDNDPRITRVGAFLRRTSLDEFPQFWNVLTGDMSLVGTRPPTPDEVANYNQKHCRRLLVKPGITGEWQVRGRSNVSDFERIVEMDLDYQRRWSVGYDINLILRTVFVVLARKGAY